MSTRGWRPELWSSWKPDSCEGDKSIVVGSSNNLDAPTTRSQVEAKQPQTRSQCGQSKGTDKESKHTANEEEGLKRRIGGGRNGGLGTYRGGPVRVTTPLSFGLTLGAFYTVGSERTTQNNGQLRGNSLQ